MKIILTILAIVVVVYTLMRLYYHMPDITKRSVTHTIDDGFDTSLGRKVLPVLEANPGKTGVHLLADGRNAFVGRVVLINKAEKSIDLQYYQQKSSIGGIGR
ncbi:MAG: hypothetical protein U9Q90_09250 [Campylobacterota bacterium]|nr:hypothetical protein [Campylobacterota bacterium]